MDLNHHYSQRLTYMYRILRGIAGVPDLNSVRLKCSAMKESEASTIIELYRDITDTYTPAAAFHSAAARPSHQTSGTPNSNLQPGVEYSCMLCRRNEHSAESCPLLAKL